MEAISGILGRTISGSELNRLKKAEYVSPQKVPFQCNTCDFFRSTTDREALGFCVNSDIRTVVEAEGCCDYWAHKGVHG